LTGKTTQVSPNQRMNDFIRGKKGWLNNGYLQQNYN
jgi:hypothetical protein